MRIRFLTPAEFEMFEASAYYEMQATYLDDNFLDIIEEATNEIADNPGFGRKFIRGYGEDLYAGSLIPFCIVSKPTRSSLWQLCIRNRGRTTGLTAYNIFV